MSAERADENLGAAILVDEDQLRARLDALRLRRDEGQPDGLAGARGADDREISEIADVEIVKVSRLRRRLENRDRRPPMIVRRRSARVIVQGHEARDVARADDRVSRDIGEISRQLRPEGRLGVQVLAHPDDRAIGQGRAGGRDRRVHLLKRLAEGHHGHVMFAVKRFRGEQLVARVAQMLGHDRFGFGRHVDLAGDAIDMRLRHRTVDDREGLRDDKFVRDRQEIIEKARTRERRVFPNRDHRAKAGVAFRRAANFQGVPAERQALQRHRFAQRHPRQMHRARDGAIDQLHEKFQAAPKTTRLRARQLLGVAGDRRRATT